MISSVGAQETNVYQDSAIFRVGLDIYFESDIPSLLVQLDSIKCHEALKSLKKFSEINEKDTFEIVRNGETHQYSDFEKLTFLKIISMIQLKSFVKDARLFSNHSWPDGKDALGCINPKDFKKELFDSLLRANEYVNERFFKLNPSLKAAEIQKLKKSNPTMSMDKIKIIFEKEEKQRQLENKNRFLSILDQKFPHQFYF